MLSAIVHDYSSRSTPPVTRFSFPHFMFEQISFSFVLSFYMRVSKSFNAATHRFPLRTLSSSIQAQSKHHPSIFPLACFFRRFLYSTLNLEVWSICVSRFKACVGLQLDVKRNCRNAYWLKVGTASVRKQEKRTHAENIERNHLYVKRVVPDGRESSSSP